VTDQTSIAAAAERIRQEFGRLDVLVNNSGIVGIIRHSCELHFVFNNSSKHRRSNRTMNVYASLSREQ
jgi:NAD(P)-dependent dehydrogenase (short-subunit alcohol dehydrogenase family)